MKTITLPTEIEQVMNAGAAMVVSISGGKDGQAALNAMVALYAERGWSGDLIVIHADLGRIEWTGTGDMVRRQVEAVNLPLEIVTAGDLVDRWKDRMNKLAGTGKPFWSSSAQRYCTSDLKRNPIDKLLRRYDMVVSVDGVRAEESPARAKKAAVSIRRQITTAELRDLSIDQAVALKLAGGVKRLALDWHSIHDWKLADVWEACGTSAEDIARRRQLFRDGNVDQAMEGSPVHHAYIRGNDRLSCSMCVLASDTDIRNGALDRPEVARELVQMEVESGFTFKHKKSLASIIATVMATS